MSAKYYCDSCGEEMKKDEHSRLLVRMGDVTVEVIHAFRSRWNGGHVCHKCIRHVVAKGKPADVSCSYARSAPCK